MDLDGVRRISDSDDVANPYARHVMSDDAWLAHIIVARRGGVGGGVGVGVLMRHMVKESGKESGNG